MMNFEFLPNEILLDIFEYLNGIDLLRTFYGHNSRFNLLLYNQFQSYRFDLLSCSKHQFDIICKQHLPFISNRVTTLTLSDNEDTPGQINQLFSYIPSFRQFIHLRSLSILHIPSYYTLVKIADELHYFSNLTRLKLNICPFGNNQVNLQLVVNSIWSLPKLTYCYYSVRIDLKQTFTLPTKLSTSLKAVDISAQMLKWNQIYSLFECTPHLEYLDIFITPFDNNHYQSSPIPTLIKLNTACYRMSDTSKMISFLKNVPNLRHLKITMVFNLINGYQWEQIIRNYLPKLKIFNLNMYDQFPDDQNIEERANELINSFQSSFWINEYKWFVRCFICDKIIRLETSSVIFYHFEKKFPNWWKSTFSHDNHLKFYHCMTSIDDNIVFDQSFLFDIFLQNMDSVCITFPINNQFWSIVPSLKTLRSLRILSYTDTYQSQLQALLDRTPYLYRLDIRQELSLPLQISLFKYNNASVRQLCLQKYNYRFNEKECDTLTHSSLGVQCEILSIKVKNRESIIILVKNMINLRALHIQCEDDEYSKYLSLIENVNESHQTNKTNKDELIQWLKDNLSSTYLISRDPKSIDCIRLWIR
ncbi:unnamed protein product [Rotaria sordida]|uniref:F-box domain-containing protein n=1 Tax=Rotaria sordida TaxID=392033 RepID=A0A815NKR5_9BILA|nr:unnamed protein product [Rotaria sordida]